MSKGQTIGSTAILPGAAAEAPPEVAATPGKRIALLRLSLIHI